MELANSATAIDETVANCSNLLLQNHAENVKISYGIGKLFDYGTEIFTMPCLSFIGHLLLLLIILFFFK